MEEDKKKIWFPAKKYGFGWGLPVTWQGWVVFLSYMLLIIIGSLAFKNFHLRPAIFYLYVIILTSVLIIICWKKGEKAEWRWGKTKKDN
jgi:hypothetical protein